MVKFLKLLSLSVVAMLSCTCCRQTAPEESWPLLSAIPSDAICAAVGESCGTLTKEYLDSTDVLRKVIFPSISTQSAALSFCHTTELTPILSMDATQMADSIRRISLDRMNRNSLHAEIIGGILVATRSESLLFEMKRHLGSGTSILDAPGFADALKLIKGEKTVVFVRNSAMGKILPRGIKAGPFERKDIVEFMKKAASWTMVLPSRKEIRFTARDASMWTHIFSAIPFGSGSLCRVLPDSTDFVLDIITSEGFRKAYDNFQDASVKMDKYRAAFSALKKETGVDPRKWEKKMGIREVALSSWNGHKVVLLRTAKKGKDSAAAEINRAGNYPEALYGRAFRLEDCSFCARRKGWIIMGSEEDVAAFASCENTMKDSPWKGGKSHALIYFDGKTVQWNKKGLRYE